MPRRRTSAPYSLRRRWTVDDARLALTALAASGLSGDAFARREGLESERLYRGRRRFADARHASERARVIAATPAVIELRPRAATLVEIVLVSGRVLRVSETIDASALARLVAALERA